MEQASTILRLEINDKDRRGQFPRLFDEENKLLEEEEEVALGDDHAEREREELKSEICF